MDSATSGLDTAIANASAPTRYRRNGRRLSTADTIVRATNCRRCSPPPRTRAASSIRRRWSRGPTRRERADAPASPHPHRRLPRRAPWPSLSNARCPRSPNRDRRSATRSPVQCRCSLQLRGPVQDVHLSCDNTLPAGSWRAGSRRGATRKTAADRAARHGGDHRAVSEDRP